MILISICSILMCSFSVQAAEFATGATEINQEAFLTLGNSTHLSPKQQNIFGLRAYGYGYGQAELGRTWNVRGKNNGGYIIHGLNPGETSGTSTVLALEPLSGELKGGSQNGTNKYLYQPAVSIGLEGRALNTSLVIIGKIGPVITNVNEPTEVYTPDYTYHRSYAVYLNGPGIISFGYNNTWFRDQNRQSTSLMLFRSFNLIYEDNAQEKLYSVTLDL